MFASISARKLKAMPGTKKESIFSDSGRFFEILGLRETRKNADSGCDKGGKNEMRPAGSRFGMRRYHFL